MEVFLFNVNSTLPAAHYGDAIARSIGPRPRSASRTHLLSRARVMKQAVVRGPPTSLVAGVGQCVVPEGVAGRDGTVSRLPWRPGLIPCAQAARGVPLLQAVACAGCTMQRADGADTVPCNAKSSKDAFQCLSNCTSTVHRHC